VVATNAAAGIPTDGVLEVAFDRLLDPSIIARQTFQLSDKRGTPFTPNATYDPVARVVTITPPHALEDQQFYQLHIVTPQSATDTNGLRAIDGATLDPTIMPITFLASSSAPAQVQPPVVDFCKDIFPMFTYHCAGAVCHTASTIAAEGLLLDSPADIALTAVGRVAQESNTGSKAVAEPAGRAFPVDMPILDPGPGATSTNGDPGNSFMLYKLLLASPLGMSTTVQPSYCNDAGVKAPPAMGPFHTVAWQPLSVDEHERLSNLIPGREMPYPSDPSVALNAATNTLTLDELELVSAWIAQVRTGGAPLVPATCAACVP
jgi:hypothetical protein